MCFLKFYQFPYSGRGRGRVGGREWVGSNIRLLNVDRKVVVTFFYLVDLSRAVSSNYN